MSAGRSLVCVLVLACGATAFGVQRSSVESDQETLVKLERRWNDAFYSRDVAFIETILADEFVATYDDGSRGDKARELALAATFNQQVTSAVQDDFSVRVYRDTAVVWFTLRVTGIRQEQQVVETLHYTDVWIVRDGSWQCVSSYATSVRAR